MTAEPVVTVVDYEEGVRRSVSVEWSEHGCCELRIVDDGKMTVIALSIDAAEVLGKELMRFVAIEGAGCDTEGERG